MLDVSSAMSLATSLAACRYSSDAAAHAALGYSLLSNSKRHDFSDPVGLKNLERAIAAFRRSMVVSQADCSLFAPAARGLAVAIRRRCSKAGCTDREHPPSRDAGDAPSNHDEHNQQVGWLRSNSNVFTEVRQH